MLGVALAAVLALSGAGAPEVYAAGTFNIDYITITVYYDATSEGPNDGSISVQNLQGDEPWTNIAGWSVSDDSYGSVTLADNEVSFVAASESYDFGIPGGATITGIAVQIERNGTFDSVSTLNVNMKKIGFSVTPVGTTKTSTEWPATDAVLTLGGPSDLWGTTWTAAEINGSGFGVSFFAESAVALPASTPWGLILTTLLLAVAATVVLLRLRANKE